MQRTRIETRAVARAGLLFAALSLTPGCVIISTDGDEDIRGEYVSARTLEEVTPGSTQEYVLSLLDEPTSRSALSDGTEIWRWTHTESTKSSSHLLLVVNASKRSKEHHNTYVQFEGGLVTKTWRD